jgi:hypothetical protein
VRDYYYDVEHTIIIEQCTPDSRRFAAPRKWRPRTDKMSRSDRHENGLFCRREGKMNSEPLLKAIIAAMMFIERSGPDEVDPDSAVKCLEQMSYELLQLAGADRKEFLKLVERVADQMPEERYAGFIREIPRMTGMVE